MKILILIQCTNLGGMEQAALEMAKEMKNLGHEPQFLSLTPVGGLGPLLESLQIPVSGIEYKGTFGWRSFMAMKKRLKSIDADALIMVGHNLMGMMALGSFCRGRRILNLHFHHEGVMNPFFWRILYRVASWRFSSFVFPSEFIRKEALTLCPRIGERSFVMMNPFSSRLPVTLDEKRLAKSALGIPDMTPLVGNAGWLIRRKRWDVFLQIAKQVLKSRPDTRFLIAGNGPERSYLEALASEFGIADKVLWIGWQRDLSDFYKSLDVLVFNSDWDAMGRTPLEAMTYGVPVVASMTHGGLGEVMNSNKHGFFLEKHDPSAMSAHVLALLSDPVLASSVGFAGRERIRELGNSRKYAEGMIDLLLGKDRTSKRVMNARRLRVASVIVSMVPYHDARWEEFTLSTGWETHLVELTDRDAFKVLEFSRNSTYRKHTLFPYRPGGAPSKRGLFPAMADLLDGINPDVLCVSGWGLTVSLAAIAWAARRGIPLVMLSESNEFDEPRVAWKEFVKRRIVSLCSAGLAGGSPQDEYLVRLGLPGERVFKGYDVVDNDHFEKEVSKVVGRRVPGVEGGESHQRPGPESVNKRPYFFACARFVEKKNFPGLIRAYSCYWEKSRLSTLDSCPSTSETADPSAFSLQPSVFDLVIAGDGEERVEIERTIRQLGLGDHVHLVGAKGYDELPAYYAHAGAFIHASTTEQWGLVVNEAMACGLPVLVSNRCGSAHDLVKEGENGWSFDPTNEEQMADLMLRIARDPDLRRRMGARSREIIAEWGPRRFASGATAAVKAALATPHKKASLSDRLILKLLIAK